MRIYPSLNHSPWARIHANEQTILRSVQILLQVCTMQIGRVHNGIVDSGDLTFNEINSFELLVHTTFDGIQSFPERHVMSGCRCRCVRRQWCWWFDFLLGRRRIHIRQFQFPTKHLNCALMMMFVHNGLMSCCFCYYRSIDFFCCCLLTLHNC